MELVEKIHSKVDKTIKYIFKTGDEQLVEISYIDNGSDKDIICVASQTMCNMKCNFCHLTDLIGEVKVQDLRHNQIVYVVNYIVRSLNLLENKRRLHISYMGSGEPLDNIMNVVYSMTGIKLSYPDAEVTFGLATILPKKNWRNLIELSEIVQRRDLSVKVHLSLHYTKNEDRWKYMPSALDIKSSIAALELYKNVTGNPVEIHYTMIKGQNDSIGSAIALIKLLDRRLIPVKFLSFNDKDSTNDQAASSASIKSFMTELDAYMIDSEYYVSPGHDISASCGEFMVKKLKKEVVSNEE